MSNTIQNPFMQFNFPNADKAAGLCKLYIGETDKDPKANQIQVYAVLSDNSELPISQPVTLSAGGVPSFNGSPVELRCNANEYSLLVETAAGAQLYYDPAVSCSVTVANLASDDSGLFVGGIVASELKTSGIQASVSEIATGKYPVGTYLNITDRAGAVYKVEAGGGFDNISTIPAGSGKVARFVSEYYQDLDPEYVGATEVGDITQHIQFLIALVGVQDPFSANPSGVVIKFQPRKKYNVLGRLLVPSYVLIELNDSTLIGDGSNVMFESAYWSGTELVSNFGQPNETRFVVNSQIKNGRISNCNAFRLFNFCESSAVENIRFFGCNQVVYALRCFYGSFRQLHARSPINSLISPCFHFESAMGALEAAQIYANGYQTGVKVSGNKDNMQIDNFSAESCPVGLSVDSATSGLTINRGYFENNFNSISLSSLSNHENVVVDNCWFFGTTNAFEALTVLSGTWRQNNILNGAILSLQNNFSCRMTVEIPTDVSPNNATYSLPSNYLLGRANNVEYIKQVYDSISGLVEFKCDVHAGPIPHSYGGTSGKLINGSIPFCDSVLTPTTLTIDTKIAYQAHEFIGIYVNVDSLFCGATVLAGQVLSSIPSALVITPSDNGGFYRFVISGFVGGTEYSGSVRIL